MSEKSVNARALPVSEGAPGARFVWRVPLHDTNGVPPSGSYTTKRLPANLISEVKEIIDPTTAEG